MTKQPTEKELSKALEAVCEFPLLRINGGKRGRVPFYRFKVNGETFTKGIPDYAVINRDKVVFIEIKGSRGRIEDSQFDLFSAMTENGIPVYIANSMDTLSKCLVLCGDDRTGIEIYKEIKKYLQK